MTSVVFFSQLKSFCGNLEIESLNLKEKVKEKFNINNENINNENEKIIDSLENIKNNLRRSNL